MYLPDYAKHTLRTLHLFSQDVPMLLRPNVFTSNALCSQDTQAGITARCLMGLTSQSANQGSE